MANKMMISIIIPAYNVEKYIGKTLESTLNQTYQDYEVIVVDDGSKDATGKICDELAQTNERLRVIHQENGGVMAARMKGLECSRGQWVTFLDGDDLLPKDSLAIFIKYLQRREYDVIRGGVLFLTEDSNPVRIRHTGIIGEYSHKSYQKEMCEKPRGLHGALFNREILKDLMVIDRTIVNHEDFIYNILASVNVRKAIGIKDITYHYIIHQGSVSKREYDGEYWSHLMEYIKVLPSQGVPYTNYMLFALTVLSFIIRVRRCGLDMDYSSNSFSDVRLAVYDKNYGFRRNLSIFLVKHPYKFLIKLVRFHPSRLRF